VKTCLAIPARMGSTRLPKKLLAPVHGKPILQHTLETALQARGFDEVILVTDHDDLAEIGRSVGVRTEMVRIECRNGSERIAAILDRTEAEIIVNLQADEMALPAGAIEDVLRKSLAGGEIVSAMYPLETWEELHDPSIVKVVCNQAGDAMYFSRSAIPYRRGAMDTGGNLPPDHGYRGHIGIYAYKREILKTVAAAAPSQAELSEKLEQLRALALGYRIAMTETAPCISINTAADLERIRAEHNRSGLDTRNYPKR
jgi:3-deoxy-D-manno-octulosonate cytidylyltransferase